MHFRVMTCVSLLTAATVVFGQEAPQAPTQQVPQAPAGVSPAPQEAPASFPPVNPADFTATTPTKQTVEDFLNAYWGYDENRQWQVQGIQKTLAEGVAHVVVLVKSTAGDPKQKDQIATLPFYTLPDGKWLVSTDSLLPFGAKPFQPNRDLLQAGANGPSQGGSSKAMEIVEFSDFECPHCKDAQPIIAKLMQDYPSIHFVYQDYPLVQVHSEAMKASLQGYCVSKAGGNEAFFKFADAVFENQVGLTPASSDQTLKDAETKAGQDPAKIAACAATPEAGQAIQASLALGNKVGVNSTPTIFVNGRGLPVTGIPYPTLQKIIEFQAKLDGVALPPAPPAPAAKAAPSLR
jgi:protein-disulfide isomerase